MQPFFSHAKIAHRSSFVTEDELMLRNKAFIMATRVRSLVGLPSSHPQNDRPLIYVVRVAVYSVRADKGPQRRLGAVFRFVNRSKGHHQMRESSQRRVTLP